MVYQQPAGARDLLPLEVAQKTWINDRLQQIFKQWGYQRIVTSTLEWLNTLTAGGTIEPSTVIQLRDNSQGTMGLRPELTASIVRAAVTRMGENTYPQRLCYRANVFRNSPQDLYGKQTEYYQAGVELLFAKGVTADAEIILLLINCLQELQIPNWQILLGEAQLTRSLLEIFPYSIRPQITKCIANLDLVTLDTLSLEPELKAKAKLLFDLRGEPKSVIEKLNQFSLEENQALNNLKSLIELLDRSTANSLPIVLDLSLLHTFDYYTGIVFEVVSFSENKPRILAQGGRYDKLLTLYDPQKKAEGGIGFSFNIEDLHACLLSTGKLPQQTPKSDWLVIPETSEAKVPAFHYAEKLRNSQPEIVVELDLGSRSRAEIIEYAKTSQIKNLVWIKADGTCLSENLQTSDPSSLN